MQTITIELTVEEITFLATLVEQVPFNGVIGEAQQTVGALQPYLALLGKLNDAILPQPETTEQLIEGGDVER